MTEEFWKVLISSLGQMLMVFITWYGIYRNSKITQGALEDSKEATPPELLRLEKWSTILKDSSNTPRILCET